MHKEPSIKYVDEDKEEVGLLIVERLPWLFLGLLGSIFTVFFVSQFALILEENISVAFFLPLIVYLSDAIGTQTQTIFIRHIKKNNSHFKKYLLKEFLLGFSMGLFIGGLIGIGSYIWLQELGVSLTVAVAVTINMTIAPFVALFVSEVLFKSKSDPALGSGPITTITQDCISILVYLICALVILL